MIKTTKTKPYTQMEPPCLVTDGTSIYLISEMVGDTGSGMVIDGEEVGRYSDSLDLEELKLYNGKVSLKNG